MSQPGAFSHDLQSGEPVLVYGGGGHGKAVIELIRAVGGYHPAGIIDDGFAVGESVLGVPVLGGREILPDLGRQGYHAIVNAVGGIGNVAVRIKVFEEIGRTGLDNPTFVHPRAFMEPSACLEKGVQVLALSYIGSSVQVGFGTLINAGVVISHDCQIGQVVNLSPGALLAGRVILEDHVQIGMGVTINIGVRIGTGARVGNGATVKKDVPAGQVVRAGTIWPIPDPSTSMRHS